MAEPVIHLILYDEPLDGQSGAPKVQPTLNRISQPYGQVRVEVSSTSPAYDQQGFAHHSWWSHTDPHSDLLWSNHLMVGPDTELNDLILQNYSEVQSPCALGHPYSAQKPLCRPDLDLDISSSLTTSALASEYLHATPRRPSPLSSSLSPIAEDQGEEPKLRARQTRTRRDLSCRKKPLPSVTGEDEPRNLRRIRDSKTGTRRKGPLKDARHSVVEKRYRTKLNDELGRLRDIIPSLRIIPKTFEEYAYREGTEMLDRPQASSKFDKATVVSKAVEYIKYIEMCNKRLSEEHIALMHRLSLIETMASRGLHGAK